MPYVLSPLIPQNSPGMWFEGSAYEKKNIYSISSKKNPPVNYDEHILRPHSLTHIETPAHTLSDGKKLDFYYLNNQKSFYGRVLVIKLAGNRYESKGQDVFHWLISRNEIEEKINSFSCSNLEKILISTDFYPVNNEGYHDPNYVLTLSQEAADYLISHVEFNLYGTSWKSTDFNPGIADRPIHNTIFKKALILENLNLKDVPEGKYFLSAFPIPLIGASESPVVPVLYSEKEMSDSFMA